jgi:hypothetical protein
MRRSASAAAGAAALAVLAGCGGGPSQDVRDAVGRLQSAARAGDAAKICRQLFTPSLAVRITRAGGGKSSCEARVRQQLARKDETIDVRSVKVRGASATAVVKEQNGNVSQLGLVKSAGTWRVNSIAAVP